MAGVVQWDRYGPLYRTQPLKNVTQLRKNIGNFLVHSSTVSLLYNIALLIASMAHLVSEKFHTDKPNKGVILRILSVGVTHSINLTVSLFFLTETSTANKECCSEQRIECRTPKKQLLPYSFVLAIICGIETLYPIFGDIPLPLKIAYIAGFVATNLLGFGSIYFAEKCCQCKKCLGLKDVKICYKNETVSVSEEEIIYSSILKRWLNIPSSNETRLAIEIKNGAVIYEFNEQHQNPNIQLHEGEYVVREIELNMIPQQDCDVPFKRATRSSKMPERNQATQVHNMTI